MRQSNSETGSLLRVDPFIILPTHNLIIGRRGREAPFHTMNYKLIPESLEENILVGLVMAWLVRNHSIGKKREKWERKILSPILLFLQNPIELWSAMVLLR
jgi:hypothetical protein